VQCDALTFAVNVVWLHPFLVASELFWNERVGHNLLDTFLDWDGAGAGRVAAEHAVSVELSQDEPGERDLECG
jgi:hypothetical protein